MESHGGKASSAPSASTPALHHHMQQHGRRHRTPPGGDEGEEEELDPRIQVELEKLNKASDEINRLELELDDAGAAFRQVLSDSTQCLNGLAKKLGNCVDKARPYYDARLKLKEAHLESQKAALRFERACSMHEAAKEMVQLAEEGYKRREEDLDGTWAEMLNHATMKVNDAETERTESENFHQETTMNFKYKEEEVQKLQKDLKRVITKSKPYFEMKAKFNQVMEEHKRTVSRLEEDVMSAKTLYSEALRSLEAISDDIHRQRLERRQKLQLGVRGAGVGAEAPSPPPSLDKGSNIEGSATFHSYESDIDEDPLHVEKSSSYSGETMLDVSHLKLEGKGIICREPAYRKKSSVTDTLIRRANLHVDPLEVAVFKTPSSDVLVSPSPPTDSSVPQDFHPPSVIRAHTDKARNASYRAAIDGSDPNTPPERSSSYREAIEPGFSSHDECTTESQFSQERNDSLQQVNIEGNAEKSAPEKMNNFSEQRTLHHSLSESPKLSSKLAAIELNAKEGDFLSQSVPGSLSPRGSRRKDFELTQGQSSISRAQEWVNKSPVPTQRRFVKSKSLIDPAAALDFDSPAASGQDHSVHLPQSSITGDDSSPREAAATKSVLISRPAHAFKSSVDSVRSLGSTPPDSSFLGSSPSSGSPSTHRKSPKLQGLILRVDAIGSTPTRSANVDHVASTGKAPALFHHSTVPPAQVKEVQVQSESNGPKGVAPSQTPDARVCPENHQAGCKTNSDPSFPASNHPQQLPAPSSSSSSATPPPPASSLSSLSSTKPAPASLITQQINKVMNSAVARVGNYNSKTAPATLGTSYRLPNSTTTSSSQPPQQSPTRNPAIRHRQQISPSQLPADPDTESGSRRSETLSVASSGQRGVFLKPPSDSSDTESIASTGPMLDDDQVELISMDFSEQSIAATDEEWASDPSAANRSHWARMSLPPRLSYLEGFIERARIISGDGSPTDAEEGDALSFYPGYEDCDKRYGLENDRADCEDALSSVADGGGGLDNADDFKSDSIDDEYTDNDTTLQEIAHVFGELKRDMTDPDSLNVLGESSPGRLVAEVPGEIREEPAAGSVCVEATIVVSPDRGFEVIEGNPTTYPNSESNIEKPKSEGSLEEGTANLTETCDEEYFV